MNRVAKRPTEMKPAVNKGSLCEIVEMGGRGQVLGPDVLVPHQSSPLSLRLQRGVNVGVDI